MSILSIINLKFSDFCLIKNLYNFPKVCFFPNLDDDKFNENTPNYLIKFDVD